jgi:hypothetical protein
MLMAAEMPASPMSIAAPSTLRGALDDRTLSSRNVSAAVLSSPTASVMRSSTRRRAAPIESALLLGIQFFVALNDALENDDTPVNQQLISNLKLSSRNVSAAVRSSLTASSIRSKSLSGNELKNEEIRLEKYLTEKGRPLTGASLGTEERKSLFIDLLDLKIRNAKVLANYFGCDIDEIIRLKDNARQRVKTKINASKRVDVKTKKRKIQGGIDGNEDDDEEDDDGDDDTAFRCCHCLRGPFHKDDNWSMIDDGYVSSIEHGDTEELTTLQDKLYCLREACQNILFD